MNSYSLFRQLAKHILLVVLLFCLPVSFAEAVVRFTASAGVNQTVKLNQQVTLSATAANANGAVNTWLWQQISGNRVVLNTSAGGANASFTSPNQAENLKFMLTAIDAGNAKAYAVVSVTVVPNDPKLTLVSKNFTPNQNIASGQERTLTWTVRNDSGYALSSVALTAVAPLGGGLVYGPITPNNVSSWAKDEVKTFSVLVNAPVAILAGNYSQQWRLSYDGGQSLPLKDIGGNDARILAQLNVGKTTALTAVKAYYDNNPTILYTPAGLIRQGQTRTLSWEVKNDSNFALDNVVLNAGNTTGNLVVGAISPATVSRWAVGEVKTFTVSITAPSNDHGGSHTGIWNLAYGNNQRLTFQGIGYSLKTSPANVRLKLENAFYGNVALTNDNANPQIIPQGQTKTVTWEITNTSNISLNNVELTAGTAIGNLNIAAINPARVANWQIGEKKIFKVNVSAANDDAGTVHSANWSFSYQRPNQTNKLSLPFEGNKQVGFRLKTPTANIRVSLLNAEYGDVPLTNDTANPQVIVQGQSRTITWNLKNNSNITLNNVELTPGNAMGNLSVAGINPARIDSWAPNTVKTFTVVVTAAGDDAGGVHSRNWSLNYRRTNQVNKQIVSLESNKQIGFRLKTQAPTLQLLGTVYANPTATYTAGGFIDQGATKTLQWVVKNTSNFTLTNVNLAGSDTGNLTVGAISPASVTSWAPGTNQTFTATVSAPANDPGGNHTGNWNLTFGNNKPLTLTNNQAIGFSLKTVVPSVSLSLTKAYYGSNVADLYSAGDLITQGTSKTLTWVVKNTSNINLGSVQLTAGSASGNLTIGNISPTSAGNWAKGAEKTFTVTVSAAGDDTGGTHGKTWSLAYNNTPALTLGLNLNTQAPTLQLLGTAYTNPTAVYSAAGFIDQGATKTLQWVVKNTSNFTLTNVNLAGSDTGNLTVGAISPATVASWAPGIDQTFTATVSAPANDPGGNHTGNWNLTFGNNKPLTLTNNQAIGFSLKTVVPSVSLSLTKAYYGTNVADVYRADDIIIQGASKTLNWVVKNTSNIPLSNVQLRAGSSAGNLTIGNISPQSIAVWPVGESKVFSVTLNSSRNENDVTYSAGWNLTYGDSQPLSFQGVSFSLKSPSIHLAMLGEPYYGTNTADIYNPGDFIPQGQNRTLNWKVKNNGNMALNAVVLTAGQPVGNLTIGNLRQSSTDINWQPNEVRIFSVNIAAPSNDQGGVHSQNWNISYGNNQTLILDENKSIGFRLHTSDPNIRLTLDNTYYDGNPANTYRAGDSITQGQRRTLYWEVTNASNVSLSNVTLNPAGVASGNLVIGSISPSTIASWGINEKKIFTATVEAKSDDTGGEHALNWSLSYGENNVPVSLENNQHVGFNLNTVAPRLSLDSTSYSNPTAVYQAGGYIDQGETRTISWTVTNNSDFTLNNVSLNAGANTGNLTIGAISPASVASWAPGTNQTFTATVSAPANDPGGNHTGNWNLTFGNQIWLASSIFWRGAGIMR